MAASRSPWLVSNHSTSSTGDAASSPRASTPSSPRVRPHLTLGESFPHLQGDALGPHGGRAQAPDGAPRPRTDERHRGHSGDGPGYATRSRRTGHQTHAPTVDATPPRRASHRTPSRRRPRAIRRRVGGCGPTPAETSRLFASRPSGGQNRATSPDPDARRHRSGDAPRVNDRTVRRRRLCILTRRARRRGTRAVRGCRGAS